MPTWQDRVRVLVKSVGTPEDEDEDSDTPFEFRPPSRRKWPRGLPSCPALAEFYAICDGGTFHPYDILPLEEIQEETESWINLDDDDEGRLDLSGVFVFGYQSEVGHVLAWDGANDRVGLFSADDGWTFDDSGGWDFLGLPMARFLEALFTPPARPDGEVAEAWAEVLRGAG